MLKSLIKPQRTVRVLPAQAVLTLFMRIPKVSTDRQCALVQASVEHKLGETLDQHYWSFLTLREHEYEVEIVVCLARKNVIQTFIQASAEPLDALVPAVLGFYGLFETAPQGSLWIEWEASSVHVAFFQKPHFYYRECRASVKEVVSTLHHFRVKHGIGKPIQIVLGGTQSQDVLEALEESLGISVEFLKQDSSPLSLGIAEVLKAFAEPPLNLLPPDYQSLRRRLRQGPYWFLGAAVLLLLTLGVHARLDKKIEYSQERLAQKQDQLVSLEIKATTWQELIKETQGMRSLLRDLHQEPKWMALLDFLNQQVTALEGLWLTEFRCDGLASEEVELGLWGEPLEASANPLSMVVSGYWVSHNPVDSRAEYFGNDLQQFVDALQQSPWVQAVEDIKLDTGDPFVTPFTITFSLPSNV